MNDVEEGMYVTSSDGQRIGKVIRCDSETFVVEKGALFPKDYELRYEYIKDIKDGGITYLLHEDLARTAAPASAPREAAAKVATLPGAAVAAAAARDADTEQELRIPLLKEEMDVEKFQRESGHVRIHKAVHTEEKHFSIPLRREELVIEHVAGAREGALSADGAFEDQTLDITLQEEDVRVGKHAVLREEVVVRKVSRAIEKDASASLRTEDLEIEDTRLGPAASSPKSTAYEPLPTRH